MKTLHSSASTGSERTGTRFFVLLALCLLAFDTLAAGRVLFVKGSAQLERAGRAQPLAKGATVEAGDVLITGGDGRVQLLMDDGDRMALRPNTRLRIDEFTAPVSSDKPGSGRAFYSLIRGGFRALTRSLGARDRSSYRVITPVATIGIRGTHYTARLCQDDCGSAEDGLYTGVTDGAVSLSNSGGQQTVGRNQFGYVHDQNSKPQLLVCMPGALVDDTGAAGGAGEVCQPVDAEQDRPGDIYTPEQSIQGTDPSGSPIDLTPGQLPQPEPPPTENNF